MFWIANLYRIRFYRTNIFRDGFACRRETGYHAFLARGGWPMRNSILIRSRVAYASMILSRLQRLTGAKPSTRRGERIYAIGDVHGRLDLLETLLGRIARHSATLAPAEREHIVFIGDLVDRGPDSAGVVRHVHALAQRHPAMTVLRGNHEEMMVRALAGEPGMMRVWLRSGGREALASYGIEPPPRGAIYDEFALAREVREAVTAPILDWLRTLPLTERSGDYFFCHAGVRPGVALRRQREVDLLWIREDFLENAQPHGAIVVHGHTITDRVDIRENRIGIDTGAYRSGLLTALYLEGTKRAILSTV